MNATELASRRRWRVGITAVVVVVLVVIAGLYVQALLTVT